MPKISSRYAQDMPEICPRYTHYNWWDIISFWGDIINLWGHIISFWGHIISFWGHVFIGGTLSFLHWSSGGKVLLGVIINNWGHIITFWGQGFIGGDYHYLGARLLATYIWARLPTGPRYESIFFRHLGLAWLTLYLILEWGDWK